MTHNELKELIDLVAEKKFAEFEVERADFRVRIVASHPPVAAASHPLVTHGIVAPAVPAAPVVVSAPAAPIVEAATPAPEPAAPAAVDEASLHIVKSPIVGTFYRAPSPTSDPFVKIGDHVETGTVLCIIEAMKLMNEIESDTTGEVVKSFVENGQPVEYGQPLFGVKTT